MAAPLNLEHLYDKHSQALFAFLLNFTRSEADTRDLLQEIFIKLARQPDLLRNARDERGFLIRLAHNSAIDLMRRRGTREKNYSQLFPTRGGI
jgi:RNA polymerase sigma-70 factor, ECF subfamily